MADDVPTGGDDRAANLRRLFARDDPSSGYVDASGPYRTPADVPPEPPPTPMDDVRQVLADSAAHIAGKWHTMDVGHVGLLAIAVQLERIADAMEKERLP